jgi:hypothetical protein
MRVSGKEPARTLTTADRCHNCPTRAVVETVLVQAFAAVVRSPLRKS